MDNGAVAFGSEFVQRSGEIASVSLIVILCILIALRVKKDVLF